MCKGFESIYYFCCCLLCEPAGCLERVDIFYLVGVRGYMLDFHFRKKYARVNINIYDIYDICVPHHEKCVGTLSPFTRASSLCVAIASLLF